MDGSDYRKYEEFFGKQPLLALEWRDDEAGSDAVGWLVINSLRGGAAGGGTRMRQHGTKEECVFLAKTMEIKFRVSGPPIGGAKSVICVNFDPHDEKNAERKRGVLSRWYKSIGPYLRHYYGTAGDLNVSEKEVSLLTREVLRLSHPQEGIVRGHLKCTEEECEVSLRQLGDGLEMDVPLNDLPRPGRPLRVADMITGFGVAKSLRHFYELRGDSLRGKRVLVEGFGSVGGASAYYLALEGAKVVGIQSLAKENDGRRAWAVERGGLNVNDLLARRENGCLPPDCPTGTAAEAGEFWNTEADAYVPAAQSHTIDQSVIDRLKGAGVRVIACGANVPFYVDLDRKYESTSQMVRHALEAQSAADKEFAVIPDFIANCGLARAFAYLMRPGARVDADSIFRDVDETIRGIMGELLAGHGADTGLLSRAYSLYVP